VIYPSASAAAPWKQFSRDYERQVMSVTSFPGMRARVLDAVRDAADGVVVDAGCGPLGLLLREIAEWPGATPIGADFCLDMLVASRERTAGCGVAYVAADHRHLPWRDASVAAIVAVNSFLPETRAEVDVIFAEAARVLRPGGRLVAVLPAFEMSLIARDRWGMAMRLDVEQRREWDTSGWQSFYTTEDIAQLSARHGFRSHHTETLTFSAPDEVAHIREIYAASLAQVPDANLIAWPMFEHLLIATR
jgi:ubiquinone/menaquinone biosynthesis C-methylase UbiE